MVSYWYVKGTDFRGPIGIQLQHLRRGCSVGVIHGSNRVLWWVGTRAWYLGSTTQCIRSHSLFARLIHKLDWRVNEFFLPALLALVQSGLHGKLFQWFIVQHDHGYLSLDVGSPTAAGIYNYVKLYVLCGLISLCCHLKLAHVADRQSCTILPCLC